MKVSPPLLILLVLLSLSNCKKEEPTLVIPGELLPLEEATAFFNQAWAAERILTAVDSVGVEEVPYCRFTMENGEEIFLKKALMGYSRAVEYEIGPEQRTVRKAWEFSYDKSIFNEATGSVQYLEESGHRLIGFMNGTADSPKIVELDGADNIVFEVNVNRWPDYYRCEKYGLYDGI